MSTASKPFTDSDFDLSIKGMTKDNGREPYLVITHGDKKPSLVGTFLNKDGGRFSQAFLSHHDLLSLASSIERVARHAGTEKISRTFEVLRFGRPDPVPSGLNIIISRRGDGLISIRLEHNDIRSAIFPLIMGRGNKRTTRLESGEPFDPRWDYMDDAIEFANYCRHRSYLWVDEGTKVGKAQMREQLNGSSSWG